MNCPDSSYPHDYVDNVLSPVARREFEAHLEVCATCRTQVASLQALRECSASLPKALPPSRDLWPQIEDALKARDAKTAALEAARRWWPILIAAGFAVILSILWYPRSGDVTPSWMVDPLAGSPQIGQQVVAASAAIRVGQWLETDATSRARLEVGAIGEVRVEPNSRVRVLGTATTDHRLELARGTLRAVIWAPPRLFFVETPSATAIDLGCAYELSVDDAGAGVLRVTSGFVALEHGGREAIVPAGMMCLTRRGVGPGTPFNVGASPELRAALERFDFENGREPALDEALHLASAEDAATLWHLIDRAPPSRRGVVVDRLAAHHPLPEGVTRDGLLRGNRTMAGRWAIDFGLYVVTARER
jgi:anti-sigma factor RsiW